MTQKNRRAYPNLENQRFWTVLKLPYIQVRFVSKAVDPNINKKSLQAFCLQAFLFRAK
jgi:hypothetical protein